MEYELEFRAGPAPEGKSLRDTLERLNTSPELRSCHLHYECFVAWEAEHSRDEPPDRGFLDHVLKELIQIAIALTSERDLVSLPARILTEARRFTHAEAGTLYLREGDRLRFAAVQNDALERHLGEQEMRRLFQSDLPLRGPSLAGYVAISRNILRLADVYEIPVDRPYAFNRAIDAQTGYRTRSVLVVPLQEPNGNVIGVFQLINAFDARNHIVPFDPDHEELIRALASLATAAVRNAQLEEVARGREAVQFVANLANTMAHEIDNPLMVIKGNVQLLAREVADPVWRDRADAVLRAAETIGESVKHLNRIAELKLADQSRVEERWRG
jgi:signal transduction histidine kinase